LWKVLGNVQAYTSPMLVTLAGKRQILVVSARRILGLNVEDGSLIWEYPWVTGMDISVAQPIVIGENRVFISASYGHGAAVIEVAPADKGFRAQQVWANGRIKNKFSTSVLYEGYLYGQVLLASGHLVLTTEEGDVVLVKATPERHEELARFTAISGKTWNVPAISDGYLLVRNAQEMAGFRIGVNLGNKTPSSRNASNSPALSPPPQCAHRWLWLAGSGSVLVPVHGENNRSKRRRARSAGSDGR